MKINVKKIQKVLYWITLFLTIISISNEGKTSVIASLIALFFLIVLGSLDGYIEKKRFKKPKILINI